MPKRHSKTTLEPLGATPSKGSETLRLEWRNPSELKNNPSNWRKHPVEQKRALAAAIQEVGWAGALLYNERTGRLIDGHARKELFDGQGRVPVLVGSWDLATEKKILATLDPLAAMAEVDKDRFDALLRDVQTDGADLAKMLEDMARDNGILAWEGAAPEDQPPPIDQAAELQAKWHTGTGQLWEIASKTVPGKCHRLLCGDCTKDEDVAQVLAGAKPFMMVTDPPYGVARSSMPRIY